MTWKRCTGCTRAISVTAFTCEYCGQLCDDMMDFGVTERETRPEASLSEDATTSRRWGTQPAVGTAEGQAEQSPAPLRSEAVSEPGAPEPFSLVSESALHHEAEQLPETQGLIGPVPPTRSPEIPDQTVPAEDARPGFEDDTWSLFDQAPEAADVVSSASLSEQVEHSPFARRHGDSLEGPAKMSVGQAEAPVAIPGTGAEPTPPSRRRLSARGVAMAGAGVLAASALIFTSLSMRGAASPEPAVPAAARHSIANPAARRAPAAVAANPAADAPTWSRVTDGRWIGRSRHAAAFEVPAVNRVHVWTRDVTPLLVVRCDAGTAEAFVFTQSAARMEPQDGDHTVRIAFDGGEEIVERWPDSAEHDALFARNPREFTEQLAKSHSLRFGFTPHNADRVTATFVVDGLADLMQAAPRQCGVKR